MGILLGAIADDYTGASDLANTFAKEGLRTVQTIGAPRDDLALPRSDAIVAALKIRAAPAEVAVAAARAADRWLRRRGAPHALYKICSTFDSTDAGNIGPVGEALREDHGAGCVPVTPAFPETGRTVYRGHLFVGDVPLDESPLKDHPINPMRDANLVRTLSRQSKGRVGLIGLDVVAKGADALAARLETMSREGCAFAIVDAAFESDLASLGAVAFARPLSIGASGLGLGLARAALRSAAARPAAAPAGEGDVGGLAAALAGSCSRATLEQIERAAAAMPVRRLDAARLVCGEAEAEIAAALDWAQDRLTQGPVLIASSGTPEEVARAQAAHAGPAAREAVGHAVEQAMSRIAQGLVARGVRRLVVAGGETSGAAVDRLAVPAFLVEREIAPGVPILRTLGAGTPMRLALKSGNFGGADFFEKAFAMMT